MLVAERRFIGIEDPSRGGVVDDAHRVSIGNADRSDQIAAVVNPMGAGHLAVAIEAELAGPHRPRRGAPAARQDRGHPGANRPGRGIVDQGLVADKNAEDISRGVVRTRLPGENRGQDPGRTAWS